MAEDRLGNRTGFDGRAGAGKTGGADKAGGKTGGANKAGAGNGQAPTASPATAPAS